MRKRTWILLVLLVLVAGVIVFNSSSLHAPTKGKAQLIVHRGVHQTYDRNGLQTEECTADRIYTIEHPHIENTISAVEAAFELGAATVEVDLQLTKDGEFAVFHDATLDCKTNGRGRIADHTMAALRELDIGFGYTADQGQSYPLRGSGVGLMPTLAELIRNFPGQSFIFDLQGRIPGTAERLSQYFQEHELGPLEDHVFYGSWPTLRDLEPIHPQIDMFDANRVKWCLQNYVATGWTGHISHWCQNTTVLVPVNYAGYLWGWPNLFVKRMNEAGTDVILLGSLHDFQQVGTPGLDTAEDFSRVPEEWAGGIWTNRPDVIAPLLQAK